MNNWDLESIVMRSFAWGGGGIFGIDWVTLLALFAVGLVYFLAPVLGYRTSRRGQLIASLWLLIAKMGLSMLRACVLAVEILDRSLTSGPFKSTLEAIFLLAYALETGLFVLAMVLFVIGLTSMRHEMELPHSLPRNFHD